MIKDDYEAVEANIEKACRKAGRSRSEVTLIAVSKTKPVEMLKVIEANWAWVNTTNTLAIDCVSMCGNWA